MAVKPKLALIPAAYKGGDDSGKFYSILPSDGVGDFSFTRLGNATRINKEGLIEKLGNNVPRLNYPLVNGVASECPTLLLEPQRKNSLTYSERVNFMDLNNVSVIVFDAISPDGTDGSADKLTPTGSGIKTVGNSVSVDSGNFYTISFFYKNIDHKNIGFYDDNTPNSEIQINLENNSFVLGSAVTDGGIENYGNGWYRAYATFVANSSEMVNNLIFRDDANNADYTADGSSIYAWGFQIEKGPYLTSYIPTNGIAVTRILETCLSSGDSDTFNDDEGVLFLDISALVNEIGLEGNRTISLSNGSNGNQIRFEYNSEEPNQIRITIVSNTDLILYDVLDIDNIKNYNKIAIKYKENDFAVWVNGIEELVSTTGSTPTGLDDLSFASVGLTADFYGNVKQIQYFDTALTDEELQELTS